MANKQNNPLILNIETSTNVCSVSLSGETGRILALRESLEDKSHSALLATFINEVMEESGVGYDELQAVSVSMGPGSYTGLRIGVSTAKGICYVRSLPLIAINTLEVMTRGFLNRQGHLLSGLGINSLLCPMIDAKRMEVYTALYDSNGSQVKETTAEIINENSFSEVLESNTVFFYGNGASKCSEFLSSSNAKFIDGIYPSARDMGILSFEAFQKTKFEDLAYFEPYYLKDFVATVPKKPPHLR